MDIDLRRLRAARALRDLLERWEVLKPTRPSFEYVWWNSVYVLVKGTEKALWDAAHEGIGKDDNG